MKDLERLVEACIVGAHARQVMMGAFPDAGLSEDELIALDERFKKLARGTEEEVEPILASVLRPAEDSPVRLIEKLLARKAPTAKEAARKATASLWQLAMEVERDGEELQDLFRLYCRKGLAVCFAQLDLEWGKDELLELGPVVASDACPCPYEATAHAFALAAMKVKNWGEKYSGLVTAATYARELEADGLSGLLPRMKALPPTSICILGHSFASLEHWSSHGTFPAIVAESFKLHNPGVEFAFVIEGGMSTSRALERYMGDVEAKEPDLTAIVLAFKEDKDYPALEEVIRRLGGRVVFFDALAAELHNLALLRPDRAKLEGIASSTGAALVRVAEMLDHHPQRAEFMSLDGIHMTSAYHKVMAVELARAIVEWGPRGAV